MTNGGAPLRAGARSVGLRVDVETGANKKRRKRRDASGEGEEEEEGEEVLVPNKESSVRAGAV